MMEYWNVDFKEIFLFMEFDFKKIFPINHCHIFTEPIIPSFQYSIIPIAKLSSTLTDGKVRIKALREYCHGPGEIGLPLCENESGDKITEFLDSLELSMERRKEQ